MKVEHIKIFASKILKLTANHTPNSTYPLPVGKVRAMCNHVLDQDQEAVQLPPLTDVEQSVLAAIKADFSQGIQPTIRSVAERLEYETHSSAQVVIDRLIKHGYIERKGSKRQICVVSQRK